MEKVEEQSFIFFLTLDQKLPKVYLTLNEHLKKAGFVLIPVQADQVQSILSICGQRHVIIISSVVNSSEMQIYDQRIRGLLKFILKSSRVSFILLSSFIKLNDYNFFSFSKNYFFIKYPLNVSEMAKKILRYNEIKSSRDCFWPGGGKISDSEAS